MSVGQTKEVEDKNEKGLEGRRSASPDNEESDEDVISEVCGNYQIRILELVKTVSV